MRHQNRCQPVGGVQPGNQVKDQPSGRFVQIAGGLVGQKQTGIVDQGSGQRHALLLTAAEFAGAMLAAILQPNFFQPLGRNRQSLRAIKGMATFSCAVNSGSR